jgi:RND family efflux transporter MFP subunit
MGRSFTLSLLATACAALCGCTHAGQDNVVAAPPTVSVSLPIQREVTEYAEYTGRTSATDTVNIRARVSGYLDKINYKEGTDIEQGAVLYEIDPRPYEAALKQAQAQVTLQEAQLKYHEAVYQRNLRLSNQGQAVSREDVQQSLAQRDVSQASVDAARAAVDQAQLNLQWTKMASPIGGLVGRTLVTRGNLIVADQTLLTTIVSQDPMYVYFDVDEPTMLRVRQLIREGKYHSAREEGTRLPVFLGLTNEQGYPHEGYLDFVNNQVSATTGTLQVRGTFANPKPPVGPRLLTPGLFVRVRIAVSEPHQALLVSQSALGTDQNLTYVYVVNENNEAERRDVQLGAQQPGGLQVVTSGLKPDDRVIVTGTQHARPGLVVQPQLVPMPVPFPGGRPASTGGGSPAPAPAAPQPAPTLRQNFPPRGQTR